MIVLYKKIELLDGFCLYGMLRYFHQVYASIAVYIIQIGCVSLFFCLATYNQMETDSKSTSDVREQASGLSDVTKESANSHTMSDVITVAPTAAKRKTAQDVEDGNLQASKQRLETLLQLETHARRTMEDNFQRVKGFTFVFMPPQPAATKALYFCLFRPSFCLSRTISISFISQEYWRYFGEICGR